MCEKLAVCKFGGTSLSTASAFTRVHDIVKRCAARRVIIASAPGKRFPGDIKITDRLARCREIALSGRSAAREFEGAREIFENIAYGLSLKRVSAALDGIFAGLSRGRDWVVSRGEELCARMLAEYLDLPYIGAEKLFVFEAGMLCERETYAHLRALPRRGAVMPGFYGADKRGAITTFPRGGSDISGAHAAAALSADVYENWTDVDGFHAIDPRIVPRARAIPEMSYRQARTLCEMGACVLHIDCVPPVEARGVPIRIKNTFAPEKPGTTIGTGMCGHACAAVSEFGETRRLSIIGADDAALNKLSEYVHVERLTGCAVVECGADALEDIADIVYTICVEGAAL